MKPINEVIADLVARGFVLPRTVMFDNEIDAFRLDATPHGAFLFPQQAALDLIACEFARQTIVTDGQGMNLWHRLYIRLVKENNDGYRSGELEFQHSRAMRLGDTESALRALWEATG